MAFESDWALIRAARPELQAYLLSNDLYWPLRLTARTPGSVQVPPLTIGNLILSRARLSALALPDDRQAELAEISRCITEIRGDWRSNWGRKAHREYAARLKLWQQYFHEMRSESHVHASVYANEVRQRVILHLLVEEMLEAPPQPEVDLLRGLDETLRSLLRPGPFVWEPEVERAFPRAVFWFLYGMVQK